MKELQEAKMDNIKGGDATITGSISGIRRISEDELCPLK